MDAVTQERILLEQDDELLNSILSDLSQYKGPFRKVLETFEALNLGEMNEAFYGDIKRGQAIKIVKLYNQNLEHELDKAKITNPILRENMLAGTEVAPKAFLNAVDEFANTEIHFSNYKRRELGSEVQLTIDYVSFRDEELYISDEDKEAIADRFARFYLESAEEEAALEAAKIIAEQYKVIMGLNKKLQMDLNVSHFNCIQPFFIDVGPNIKPNLRYISGLNARMNRMKKYR